MDQRVDYTTITTLILKEINNLRSHPCQLLPLLKDRCSKYEDKKYYPNRSLNIWVDTKEGKTSVQTLIIFLQRQKQCPKLQWSFQLHSAADRKANLLKSTTIDPQLTVQDLVREVATWHGMLAELVFYGFIDPVQLLIQLLLQDGHPNKNNRRHIFDPKFSYLGVGISENKEYQFVVVFFMAVSIQPIQTSNRQPQDEPYQWCQVCDIY